MKTKTFVVAMAALVAVGAYIGANTFSQRPDVNGLQLANIEALVQEENPCDNYNGYRRISNGDEKIYDCCYKEQIGKGKDDCKRW